VLASSSPRRRDLLAQLGLTFEVRSADVDEVPRPGEAPADLAARLAREKALAVARRDPAATVIAADTVVDVDGTVLGKPRDHDDARRMLRALSGRTHRVHTGVAVRRADGSLDVDVETTDVTFVELSEVEVDWYVGTGEPLDKAGGYGLQGAGGAFVERVDGSVSAVLGLPLSLALRMLG
jgi:nucleoside triphosphate pyrophosphatase